MLHLVDSVVDDVAGVGPELGGITTILGRDVNITDLDANIQARVYAPCGLTHVLLTGAVFVLEQVWL